MKALFAGSFDPFTVGHLSIAERALALFDSLIIGIGINTRKTGLWTPQERVKAISSIFASDRRVWVESYSCLTAEFARKEGAGILVRGVRGMGDFEAEMALADTNRKVLGIDTVFIPSDPELSFVSSSMVRELINNGYDASSFIAGDFKLPPI